MTAQLSDRVEYRDAEWDLAGIDGEGLFDPADHGLEPRPAGTACYRGFVCTYRIEEDQLLLASLCVASDEDPPELCGTRPHTFEEDILGFTWRYSDVRAPIAFEGGLLLARGFIDDLYVHMGFHPAWKYRDVLEVLFENGKVVEARDCSSALARVRERLENTAKGPGPNATEDEMTSWIALTFSRKY